MKLFQTPLASSGGGGSGIDQLTGDVTAGPGSGSQVATIPNDTVTNAKAANMATQTIKGRTTAGTGDPEDLTATQATAILNAMVGDSGAGGTKGLAPAPAAGDAAAGKFLKADGTWVVPSDVDTGITQLTGDVTAGPGSGSQAATIPNNTVTNAKAADMATSTFKGRTTAGTGDPEDLSIAQAKALLNLTGTNSGDVTLAAVGASPNANAATLSGQVLNLQPADGSNPGVVTTGTQTLAGAKTFSGSHTHGASISDAVTTITSDTTLNATHNVVYVDATSASVTVTLPTAIGISGTRYKIIRIDAVIANFVKIIGTSSQTINGFAADWCLTQWTMIEPQSNNANWVNYSSRRVPYVTVPSGDSLTAATIGTTETAFATSFPFPANYFESGRAVSVSTDYKYTTSATAPTFINKQILRKAGPTDIILLQSPTTAPANNITTNHQGWSWRFQSTTALSATATFAAAMIATGGALPGMTRSVVAQGVTGDSTAAQTLMMTATYGANTAGNTTNVMTFAVFFEN